jgi:hypothetical protein
LIGFLVLSPSSTAKPDEQEKKDQAEDTEDYTDGDSSSGRETTSSA